MQPDTRNTRALLIDAIRHLDQVTATYNGRRRSFCPHALGTKGDKQHVLVYQFAAERLDDGAPAGVGWRCLDIERLTDVTVTPGEWHSAPNIYNPQSCLDAVDVVVQPFPPLYRTPTADIIDGSVT